MCEDLSREVGGSREDVFAEIEGNYGTVSVFGSGPQEQVSTEPPEHPLMNIYITFYYISLIVDL